MYLNHLTNLNQDMHLRTTSTPYHQENSGNWYINKP